MNKLFLAASPVVPLVSAIAFPVFAQGPQAVSPYNLGVFATAPAGLSAPDSIAVLGDLVFVGYGDNHAPDGSDGLSSQIVEYRMDGSVVHIYTVLGHNDGLNIDPITHKLCDSSRYLGEKGNPISTSPAEIADAVAQGCVPFSESPSNANGIGPTQDDVSLVWLNQNICSTEIVVDAIETQSPANDNVAGIGEIFSGRGITQLFNAPGISPTGDPRTPDILVTPNIGVTYSGSGKKTGGARRLLA
jgi:hypothetical protein